MTADIASIVAAAAPLLFVTMGETITEKAGVINLSLEGSVMLSALAGFVIALETDQALAGFAGAALVGVIIALLVAYGSINLKLNQVAVGFVLALLAVDLSTFLGSDYVGERGARVPPQSIPGLEDLPFVGPVLFDHNLMVYAALLTVIATWFLMFKTPQGLVLQGIGERPEAAHSRGVAVNRLRYLYTGIGGALVGIGGAAFTLDVKLGWSFNHTLNFGWIALAIVIFGGWHPFRVAAGVFLFGALQILALKLQPVSWLKEISQILPSLPFPLMIFALLFFNQEWIRNLTDRVPTLRRLLLGDPPSAIGTVFEVD